MRLFQITDFKLEKPLTIMHTDAKAAADMFIMSFVRSMGNLPNALYEVEEVAVRSFAFDSALLDLLTDERPGFVWESGKKGWELFNPYADW